MNDADAGTAVAAMAARVRESEDAVERSLDSLYDSYSRSLYRFAPALTGSSGDARMRCRR